MAVPALHHLASGNANLRGIQARGLPGFEETAFKAALIAEYLRAMVDAGIHAPYLARTYNAELIALQTLTDAQLAALSVRT